MRKVQFALLVLTATLLFFGCQKKEGSAVADASAGTQSSEDERIIGLEMKISYLEDFVRQLQEVVLEQDASLERLVAENRHIKTRLADLAGQLEGDIPNRRPPHY